MNRKTKNEQNNTLTGVDYLKKCFLQNGCLIIGSFLMAFSLKCIFEPAGLVTGGFSGLAVIVERIWNIPLWISVFLLNLPLFIAAFLIVGKKIVIWSIFTTLMLTIFIAVIPRRIYIVDDIFLSALVGSIMNGTGIGLILVWDVTSGGVDLLALLLHKYVKRVKTVWIMFALDGVIIILGAFIFGLICGAYSVISVFLISFISDKIIEGPKTARAVYIISDNYTEIANAIIGKIGRGVTGFDSVGMYSDKGRRTLMCIAGKREIVGIKKLVKEIDKNAFLIISAVTEVIGEGFFVKNI